VSTAAVEKFAFLPKSPPSALPDAVRVARLPVCSRTSSTPRNLPAASHIPPRTRGGKSSATLAGMPVSLTDGSTVSTDDAINKTASLPCPHGKLYCRRPPSMPPGADKPHIPACGIKNIDFSIMK